MMQGSRHLLYWHILFMSSRFPIVCILLLSFSYLSALRSSVQQHCLHLVLSSSFPRCHIPPSPPSCLKPSLSLCCFSSLIPSFFLLVVPLLAPADPFKPFIIFSNRHEIRRIDLHKGEFSVLVPGLRNTIALDFHFNERRIQTLGKREDMNNICQYKRWREPCII